MHAVTSHAVLIYFLGIAILAGIALFHLGRKILHHVIIGWLAGLLAAGPLAGALSRPVFALPGGSTIPARQVALSSQGHQVTASVTSAPALTPALALIPLALLIILGLVLTIRARKAAADEANGVTKAIFGSRVRQTEESEWEK